MLVVTYGLLGGFGFFIYRGMKKNEAYRQAQLELQQGKQAPVT